MTKTVAQFEAEVFEAIRTREYVELPPVIYERGVATIKLRFRIKAIPDAFLQFYYNETNDKTSLALIIKESRAYGHNFTPLRGWHRHIWPTGNHNYSPEARQSITVSDFISKVDEIIEQISKKINVP